jgi:catecholate siderophore receptor
MRACWDDDICQPVRGAGCADGRSASAAQCQGTQQAAEWTCKGGNRRAASQSTTPPATVELLPTPNARGDIGYEATRTTSATKTGTPLRNVPQSITVVTDKQIKDQNFQSIGDVTRYVPGVIVHQGEGNRDQVSIRGQVA